MDDYSEAVESLLDDMQKNDDISYGSSDLLVGIDSLCRILYGIAEHELTAGFWARLGVSAQRSILFYYHELGRQGERLCDDLTYPVEHLAYGKAGDIEALVQGSAVAQRIAAMPLDSDRLNPKIMKSLTQVTLNTLLEAKPLLDTIPSEKYSYYNTNLTDGLQRVRRAIQGERA